MGFLFVLLLIWLICSILVLSLCVTFLTDLILRNLSFFFRCVSFAMVGVFFFKLFLGLVAVAEILESFDIFSGPDAVALIRKQSDFFIFGIHGSVAVAKVLQSLIFLFWVCFCWQDSWKITIIFFSRSTADAEILKVSIFFIFWVCCCCKDSWKNDFFSSVCYCCHVHEIEAFFFLVQLFLCLLHSTFINVSQENLRTHVSSSLSSSSLQVSFILSIWVAICHWIW